MTESGIKTGVRTEMEKEEVGYCTNCLFLKAPCTVAQTEMGEEGKCSWWRRKQSLQDLKERFLERAKSLETASMDVDNVKAGIWREAAEMLEGL
jgi:hypothetical protein